jgi:hypothetical protein
MKTYTKKEVRELLDYVEKKIIADNTLLESFLKDNNLLDELEVGWYKINKNNENYFSNLKWLCYHDGNRFVYGFECSGDWCLFKQNYKGSGDEERATEEEVKEALISEAKRRGFKEGVRFVSVYPDSQRNEVEITRCNFSYDGIEEPYLFIDSMCAFYNGKWATIIEEPKEMTVEEISKALGHEVKIVK